MSGLSEPSAGAAPLPTRVRVVLTGRVQGVWFRDSCREQARAVGAGGWVRNRGDGAVEAEFEGSAAARGIVLTRPESLNGSATFTAALAEVVKRCW